MARFVFNLPDVGEGIAEAEVVGWHVEAGGVVAEDDPLVDVMTDKATVEIPSPRSGRVLATTGRPGDKIQVGAELVVLEVGGEAAEASAPPPSAPPPASPAPEELPQRPTEGRSAPLPANRSVRPGKPLASPAVRRRAHELGIPLQFVAATGPAGRITHADLDAQLASGSRIGAAVPARPAPADEIEEIKIIGLRRRIAERMQEAKRRIPHYAYVEEIDVTALEALRAHLNARYEERTRLTMLPFLMAALARAVPRFPMVNALFDDDAGILRRHAALHIGIATQTPQGLLVPVVRNAAALGLWEAAAAIARLAGAARDGKATRDELTGSTITITSLGPIGGIVTTPVINYPEVAIVGVNRIVERPVVLGGQVVVRKMMNLSSSFDHRVVDGSDAAQFIQEIKSLLEQPATLFIP